MKIESIIEKSNLMRNGSFLKMDYKKDLFSSLSAKAKKEGHTVCKYTTCTVRKGIAYSNLKSTKEAIENGKVLTHELPSWQRWRDDIGENVIEGKDGKLMYRFYIANQNPITSLYEVDGEILTKAELKEKGIMINSFFSPKETTTETITIYAENVIDIYQNK